MQITKNGLLSRPAVLRKFENDLVEHIYLKNNILFPKLLQFKTSKIVQEVTTDPHA